MEKKLSAATKRAIERGYESDPTWYCEFNYYTLQGLEPQQGVHRRDPSSIIQVDGVYYTYYSKSYGKAVGFGTGNSENKVFPWDQTDIWYATSTDGYTWKEEGIAVSRGEKGTYDDRSVFTPEVLYHEGKVYLVYQAVQAPYLRRTKNTVGMSIADNPKGPFKRLPQPILYASNDGEWEGEEDNRFYVKSKGSFDSHKVHDPSLFFFNNKFYLYYKGERMGEQMFMGGRETKWGVAIADKPEGPYTKSEYNPVTNSGHETCLWHYDGGLGALLTTDGVERNTFQYTKDGVNFEIMGAVKSAPHAAGPCRVDPKNMISPLDGIRWGLSFEFGKDGWNHLVRYEVEEGHKTKTMQKRPWV